VQASEYTEERYLAQLEEKVKKTRAQFSKYGVEDVDVYRSEAKNYRMRAEFRVWHDEDDLYYIMFDQATKQRYRVNELPAATSVINELMPKIIEAVKAESILKKKIFQIDYLSTLNGEVVVSLLYHKQLCEQWEAEMLKLREHFRGQGYVIDFIGRARKQKKVLDRDFVVEKLSVNGSQYTYQQIENSFTQPNGKVAEKMLEWAVDQTKGSEGDLIELYCGNGNFSIALAQNFREVLATELAKPSVDSAQWNIKENDVTNLKIARLSAEEFTDAMNGVREFRRLQQQSIEIDSYNFSTVFVDPPRAGMSEDSVEMIRKYDTILYISCNPDTLEENVIQLAGSHSIEKMALFDQFPYTHHREVGVVLKRI